MGALDSIFAFCRPVYFEREDEDSYPYFGTGTLFLVRWNERYFAVTARHVLRGLSPELIRVLADVKSDEFLPIELSSSPSRNDFDYEDICILTVAAAAPKGSWQRDALYLNQAALSRGRSGYVKGRHLVLPGFPTERRAVDHDARKLKHQLTILDGQYEGPSSAEAPYKHVMRLASVGRLAELEGFSGSPVFTRLPRGLEFGGIAIQGNSTAGLVHFIDNAVLATALAIIVPS